MCGPLVRGSLLGLHGNMAREEKYIVRGHENHIRDRLEHIVLRMARASKFPQIMTVRYLRHYISSLLGHLQ